MCEFCTQHGEGKKWYLQAKNYSQELMNAERQQFMDDFLRDFEHYISSKTGPLDKMLAAQPEAVRRLFPKIIEQQKKEHWGQVVPIEEIEEILDMSLSVHRVSCVCRSALRGYREARFCFGIVSADSGKVSPPDYPDFSSDLEALSREDAKKAFRKLDRSGLVHTVWTFGTPYIGGICNCSVNDCMALKTRTRLGLPTFFKAEYVARVDWEECNGCRNCMKACSFGAISYSPHQDKCFVNQIQCYGCGVCRAVCDRDAITMLDRNAIPALANEW